MNTISLCMIVKNEEETLERCLNCVKDICDEIIIVDTGSTDKTKEIAAKFTDKIYDYPWNYDFAAARNFAFRQATKDYILWLDADDILLEEDQQKLRKLKEELTGAEDAVSMWYHIDFDEYGQPAFSYRRYRLVKREKNFRWFGAVHEYLAVSGNLISSDVAVTHRPKQKKGSGRSRRNLDIYEKRLAKGEALSPRDLFYYANELKDHGDWEKAVHYYEKFLATDKGWIEDKIWACIYMAVCFRALGDLEKEIDALLRTLDYDVPWPEVSCRMGDLYKERALYEKAIIWYLLAVSVDGENRLGFRQPAYATWYPYLQLTVCLWKTGQPELAVACNQKAKKFRPHDPAILRNEKFFKDYFAKK